MKIMATSFKRAHACTAALSPPNLQQATTDPHLCQRLQTLTDKSGSVSCGVTAPFSWHLVHITFCLCPPRVCFPNPCKFCNQIPPPSKVKFPGGSDIFLILKD